MKYIPGISHLPRTNTRPKRSTQKKWNRELLPHRQKKKEKQEPRLGQEARRAEKDHMGDTRKFTMGKTQHRKKQQWKTQKAENMKTDEGPNNSTQNSAWNTLGKTAEKQYVTIQNDGRRYEAGLVVDNSNNCPLQKQLRSTRYRIPEPPRLMRNKPKFYTA